MKKLIKTVCAVSILAAANQATAESFQLGITGIFKPAACTPTIDNGGTVDYGIIKTDILNKNDYNRLENKEIGLNISCDAPTKVAIAASSGRKGSALVSNIEGKNGAGKPFLELEASTAYEGAAGFGMDGETKIGAYTIVVGNAIADGEKATEIRSSDKVNWSTLSGKVLYTDNGNDQYVTFRDGTNNAPGAFTTASFPLIIKGYINKASELDISKPIKLDGLTNIEMVYL